MLKRVEGQRLCLTFDDGPDPDHTPLLLDLLDRHACRATFFLLGDSALRHPTLVRRIVREGHSLGNHTLSHLRARRRGGDQDRQQVRRCQEILADIAGHAPLWFRPPWGRLTPALAGEASRLGMTTVLWSRSAIDWGPLGSRSGIARRLDKAVAGDILLLHDAVRCHNHPARTLAVLPARLERWRERGIACIGLDEYVAATTNEQPADDKPVEYRGLSI